MLAQRLIKEGKSVSEVSGHARYLDYSSDSPYLYNANTQTWVDYEEAESLAHKALYVRDYRLGGMHARVSCDRF